MSVPPESATPPPPPPEPASSQPPAGDYSGDRNLAMLTHLSGIILGVIVPLIVWLINKDNPAKAYLTTESKEALNFQITILIGYIISWILLAILIGGLLWFLVWILDVVFCILAAIAVSNKGTYRYPFALRLIN